MTVIKTVNLTKRYGTLVALSNLNLEINEGDCFGFIGRPRLAQARSWANVVD